MNNLSPLHVIFAHFFYSWAGFQCCINQTALNLLIVRFIWTTINANLKNQITENKEYFFLFLNVGILMYFCLYSTMKNLKMTKMYKNSFVFEKKIPSKIKMWTKLFQWNLDFIELLVVRKRSIYKISRFYW